MHLDVDDDDDPPPGWCTLQLRHLFSSRTLHSLPLSPTRQRNRSSRWFSFSKKLSSVNMLLSGRAQHVATPGPWHRFLCLLRDGWWGGNTLLSAHHIPPLCCTGLRRGWGQMECQNTWITLIIGKLLFLLSGYNPLQYDKNWLSKDLHFPCTLGHFSA